MTFEEFQKSLQTLAERIQADTFSIDGIVAIARGGWIPARLLAQQLKIKQLYSYGVTYADAERTILTTYSAPFPELKNKKLLLVEDFLESGKSMAYVRQLLESQENDVRSFAVRYMPKSIIIPDYTLGEIDSIPKLPWD